MCISLSFYHDEDFFYTPIIVTVLSSSEVFSVSSNSTRFSAIFCKRQQTLSATLILYMSTIYVYVCFFNKLDEKWLRRCVFAFKLRHSTLICHTVAAADAFSSLQIKQNKIHSYISLSLSLSFHKNKTTEKYFFSAFGVITQSPSIKMICKENINHYICESNKYSIFIAISILKINISLKFINDINLSGISDTLSLQIFVLFYFYLLN